jgi:Acetyltransferase (GNAT) domain
MIRSGLLDDVDVTVSPQIRLENPLLREDWDARLANQRDASFFHGAAWARVLVSTYGFEPVYLAATCGNRLLSALPIMDVKSRLTGRRGVALPFTDCCGPIGDSPESVPGLIEEALRLAHRRAWRYLEIRDFPGSIDWFPGSVPSISFYGHTLELGSEAANLFEGMEGSVRRAIRKAEKTGLTVEFSNSLHAVREFYSLHCKTRRRHGAPPQPYQFFLNLHRWILSLEMGMVVSAKYRNRTVASAIFFHSGPAAIYKFGASDAMGMKLRANNLVMWEAIRWLAAHGKKVLDFGRTSMGNPGLRRFKLGWGTRERVIRYLRFDLRANRFVSRRDDAFGLQARLFRALPGFALRFAGAALYRHIA